MKRRFHHGGSSPGFSLIEIMLYIVIIGFLTVLFGPLGLRLLAPWLRSGAVATGGAPSAEAIVADRGFPLCEMVDESPPKFRYPEIIRNCLANASQSCRQRSMSSLEDCVKQAGNPPSASRPGGKRQEQWFAAIPACQVKWFIAKSQDHIACKAAMKAELKKDDVFFTGVIPNPTKERAMAEAMLSHLASLQETYKTDTGQYLTMPAIGKGTLSCNFNRGTWLLTLSQSQCHASGLKYWCEGSDHSYLCHAQGVEHFVIDPSRRFRPWP